MLHHLSKSLSSQGNYRKSNVIFFGLGENLITSLCSVQIAVCDTILYGLAYSTFALIEHNYDTNLDVRFILL